MPSCLCTTRVDIDEKSELYVRLNYTQYKALQAQLQDWDSIESSHVSVEGFYHKAMRLEIGSLILEVQGPTVKAPLKEVIQFEKEHRDEIMLSLDPDW